MTKKQKIQAGRDAWKLALKEGRVVRWDEMTLSSYPTVEAAKAKIVEAGFGTIVQVG